LQYFFRKPQIVAVILQTIAYARDVPVGNYVSKNEKVTFRFFPEIKGAYTFL
jgi:hypothetical protein